MFKDENQKIPTEALAALERGNKIEAIKIIRVAGNLGLKEAKDLVELYLEKNPELKARMDQANKEIAAGFFRWLIPLIIFGVWAYYYFGRK